MKTNATQSIKFSKLKRRLAIPHWQAVGLLESVWLFTQVNAPAGDIGRHADEDIAAAIEWQGDPAELISTLVECGWLDLCDTFRVVVHDWNDHIPRYLKGALAKNEVAIATKQPAKNKKKSKQPAYATKQNENEAKQPAPILSYPNQTKPNLTTPQPPADAGGGASVETKKQNRATGTKPEHPHFAAFWQAYPRKIAKPNALAAFAKIDPDETLLAKMLAAVDWQSKSDSWTKDGGRFIPHPATWLNARRWEDERTKEITGRTSSNGYLPPSMQPTGNGIVPSIYRTAEPGKTLHDEITPEMLRVAMYNDPFHKKPAAS